MSYPYIEIDGHKVSLVRPFTIDDQLITNVSVEVSTDYNPCDAFGNELIVYDDMLYTIRATLHNGRELILLLRSNHIYAIYDRIMRQYIEYVESHDDDIASMSQLYMNSNNLLSDLNNDLLDQCYHIEHYGAFGFMMRLSSQGRLISENNNNCNRNRTILSPNAIREINFYDANNNLIMRQSFASGSWTTRIVGTYEPIYNIIHSHSYKPNYQKHFMPGENENFTLLLGAEIEVDGGGKSEEHGKKVLQIMNGEDDWSNEKHIFCVSDGSLYNGLEFPTQPCSLEYHKTLPYQEMFEYLDDNDYKAHDTSTCGLHIHINRSFFGDKEKECIGKLIYIVEKFNDDFSVIGRRDCKYSKFLGYKGEKCKELYEISDSSCETSVTYKNPKYNAINLLHKDTIEIRAFKGTLKYSTFINTLEFVFDLAHFVKNHTEEEVENMQWSDLYDTFSDELKKYYDERKQIENEKSKSNTITSTEPVATFYRNRACAFNANNSCFNLDSLYDLYQYNINERVMEELRLSQAPVEKTNEEKVKDLKQKLKTERNYMAKIKLQKEICQLQKEIKQEKKRKRRN